MNGSWCFNVAESEATDTCEIIGTKGRITFPFFGNYISWKTDEEEQTLTFVPKALAVVSMLIVLLPWMLRSLIEFTTTVIQKMPQMAH